MKKAPTMISEEMLRAMTPEGEHPVLFIANLIAYGVLAFGATLLIPVMASYLWRSL